MPCSSVRPRRSRAVQLSQGNTLQLPKKQFTLKGVTLCAALAERTPAPAGPFWNNGSKIRQDRHDLAARASAQTSSQGLLRGFESQSGSGLDIETRSTIFKSTGLGNAGRVVLQRTARSQFLERIARRSTSRLCSTLRSPHQRTHLKPSVASFSVPRRYTGHLRISPKMLRKTHVQGCFRNLDPQS